MNSNPYEPPRAGSEATHSDQQDKAHRVNLINRRTVAYFIESIALTPIASALNGLSAHWWAGLIGFSPYMLVRDLIGTAQSTPFTERAGTA
ncbi:MAG: hypothetical protein ACI9OJ_003144, partial [Myxococcota bacterium]